MVDGIWDDGEWITWDTINGQIHAHELREYYPHGDLQLLQLFEDLVDNAEMYHNITGRHLPIFGELGEIFAEITFGIERHRPNTQGSDGKIGNDFVEIKTISPEKKEKKVEVKRQGNFNKLIIVKINHFFEFDAQMIDRKDMSKGNGGKVATVSWSKPLTKK